MGCCNDHISRKCITFQSNCIPHHHNTHELDEKKSLYEVRLGPLTSQSNLAKGATKAIIQVTTLTVTRTIENCQGTRVGRVQTFGHESGHAHQEASSDLGIEFWAQGEEDKVLRGAHGEADKEEAVKASVVQDVVDLGRVVQLSCFIPGKVPEGCAVGTGVE